MLKPLNYAFLFSLGCVSAFIAALVLLCVDEKAFFSLLARNPAMFIDFCKIYEVSRMIASGHGYAIYDVAARLDFLKNALPAEALEASKFINYPPVSYLLFMPFVALPLTHAYVAWVGLSTLFGASALIYLRKQISKSDSLADLLLPVLLLSSSVFSFSNDILGQTGWFMLGLSALFFAGLLKGNDILCGITLALCTVKFQFLIIFVAPVILLRRWKLLFIAAAIDLVFLLASVACIGVENMMRYPHVVAELEKLIIIGLMINLRGVLYVLHPGSDEAVMLLSALATVAIIFWLWFTTLKSKKYSEAISLSCLVYLLFTPHDYLYDELLLGIPLIVKMKELSLVALGKKGNWKQKAETFLFVAAPFLWLGYLAGNEAVARAIFAVNALLFILGLADLKEERLLLEKTES